MAAFVFSVDATFYPLPSFSDPCCTAFAMLNLPAHIIGLFPTPVAPCSGRATGCVTLYAGYAYRNSLSPAHRGNTRYRACDLFCNAAAPPAFRS